MGIMKNAIFFFAGSVLTSSAVVLAGGRSAVTLWLGFALALALVAILVYFAGIRRVARFLSAFADAWGTIGAVEKSLSDRVKMRGEANRRLQFVDRSGYRKPSTKQRDQILEDTIDEYLDGDTFTAPVRSRVS